MDTSKYRENRAYAMLEKMADDRSMTMNVLTQQPVHLVVEWFKLAGVETDVNVVRETLLGYRKEKGLD